MNRLTSAVFLSSPSSPSSLPMHDLAGCLGDQTEKPDLQTVRHQLQDILGMVANQSTPLPPSSSSLSSNNGCVQKQQIVMFDPIEDEMIETNSSLSSFSIPPKPSHTSSPRQHSIDEERNKKGEENWDWIGEEEEEEIQSAVSSTSISNDLTVSFLDFIEPDCSTSNPPLFASKRIRSSSSSSYSTTQEHQQDKNQSPIPPPPPPPVPIHRPSHSFRSLSLSIPSPTPATTRSKPSSSLLPVRCHFIRPSFA